MHDDENLPYHFHLEGDSPGAFEDVEGVEKFTLTSVGIDIGSSTSHLVFSRLTLRRRGADLSARFEVTDRAVLHRSPIILTPYVSSTIIDTQRLETFVERAYREADLRPDEVDTGVVVVTGEALNKDNAEPIAKLFARQAGDFICVSAGPHHEALLAAHGSGAVALSRDENATVLNVDVGGGTTKFSVIRNGVVADTAAISVGARLLAFDQAGHIVRVEPPARKFGAALGCTFEIGRVITDHKRRDLAALMATVLFDVIDPHRPHGLVRDLWLAEPLHGYTGLAELDCIVFSGGVSEYVYGRDNATYGDLGPWLGAAIRRRLESTPALPRLGLPAEGIRATVIGAGEYTMQASGVTSYVSRLDVLPAFGLKVAKATEVDGSVAAGLAAALREFDLIRLTAGMALALAVESTPTYRLLRTIAEEIRDLVGESDAPDAPVFLIVDADVARSLGSILKEELGLVQDIVALDGIDIGDLDYVDIGRPIGLSGAVPVTVKSLAFPSRR